MKDFDKMKEDKIEELMKNLALDFKAEGMSVEDTKVGLSVITFLLEISTNVCRVELNEPKFLITLKVLAKFVERYQFAAKEIEAENQLQMLKDFKPSKDWYA